MGGLFEDEQIRRFEGQNPLAGIEVMWGRKHIVDYDCVMPFVGSESPGGD